MRKMLTAAALAVATLTGAHAQEAKELNFGIISTESSLNQKKNWEPFLAEMSKALGMPVKGFYATDYAAVIEGMRFKKIDLAWYGNKSAMEAVDRANGEVFAQTRSADGSEGYYAHLIVHRDSPYQKLEDILKCDKSIDFGIGDPNSTSGFLVPMSYVFGAKSIEPRNCFKTIRNANHQANSMAVANKQVAAATNNSEDLQRLEKNAPDSFKQIRVIWTSPLIPLDPIVWRKDLDPAVKAKIYTFLMGYGRVGSAEDKAKSGEILKALIWAPFKPSNDNQLLPIRILEANRALMKLQGEGAETRKAEIEKVQAEIKDLQTRTDAAEKGPFKASVARFLELDSKGDDAAIRKQIGEFAAAMQATPTN